MSTILLVEDEPHLLMALEDTLLEEGFKVVTAEDGDSALSVLDNKRVDLVVSDVMMPGMDGFELCRHVRNRPTFGSLPFIFLTALGKRDDQRNGWEAGGDAYLVKPFDPEELLSLIHASQRRIQQIQACIDPLINELQMLDRMKTEHLALVSHELKGPLTAIQGFSELLLSGQPDLDKIQPYVAYIHQESTGLAEMIDAMLALSAFERGAMPLADESVDLAELCREVVQQATMYHTRHRFRLQLQAPEATTQGDRLWLKRALLNLVQNASKYSPPDREITVACERLAEGVRVLVIDQGIGMSEAEQQRLGEWFYRIQRPETKGIPGSGLGLAMVKRVIDAHQGEMVVDSQVGVGTTIGFVLPL